MKNRANFLDHLNAHPKPTSRRDFIKFGLTAAGGYALLPTLGGWMSFSAKAGEKSELPAVLCFDLAGGAALVGNFQIGKKGGPADLLKSYNRMGFDPRTDAMDSRFGVPMPVNVSKIFAGMTQVMSAQTQAQFRFGTVLHKAENDRTSNPLSLISLFCRAGATGKSVSMPLGSRQSISGGNSQPTKNLPEYRAFFVSDVKTYSQSFGLAPPFQSLSGDAQSKLAEGLSRLSSYQAQRALQNTGDPKLLEWITRQYRGFKEQLATSVNLDPRGNSEATSVYQLTDQDSPAGSKLIRAALAYGAISRLTGPATITIEDCDYHDSTQTTGDTKDLEIGQEIGKAIELAARMKTPLFVHVITDGGINAKEGSRAWVGDDAGKCLSLVGYYHPQAAPKYRSISSMQIGAYIDDQAADQSTLIGGSETLASYACLANFLSVSGRLGELSSMVGNVFIAEELDSLLMFDV